MHANAGGDEEEEEEQEGVGIREERTTGLFAG